MSTESLAPTPPSVGGLLSETFATVRTRPTVILGISAGTAIPMVLISRGIQAYARSSAVAGVPSTGGFIASIVIMFMIMAATQVATAAMAVAVIQHKRGRDAGLGECFGTGLRRLSEVLQVSVLSGLFIAVGYVLCIVPGVIVALSLVVAVPVTVIENLGVMASLKRSRDLSSGYRAVTFGTFLLVALIPLPLSAPSVLLVTIQPVLSAILSMLSYTISIALSTTCAAILYYRLRLVKEGVDVEHLAAVFE